MSYMAAAVSALYASFNRFELELTQEQVDAVALPGANDPAVLVLSQDAAVSAQLDEIGPDAIRDELREYGSWDETELADDAQNRQRILWLAAWNIFEGDI